MTIRRAAFADINRILDLMAEMHVASRYADVAEFDRACGRALLQQCLSRNGGLHDGGALLVVSEVGGVIEGFMLGMLDRIYHALNRLAANDVYLYQTERANKRDMGRLIDAYIAWARDNPKVAVIRLSWTDAIEGAERIDPLYRRKGFRRVGAIYECSGGQL